MFEGTSRADLRGRYLAAWRKFSARSALEPLEAQIAGVIEAHPEYVPVLEAGESALAAEFTPETGRENPFLHMGMHLAIREQVSTDRPQGIAGIHARLVRALGSEHAAEHAMMEALGETLWEAQRAGADPDETGYLARLRRI
jgi:Domain of unknown function (DUF1841)